MPETKVVILNIEFFDQVLVIIYFRARYLLVLLVLCYDYHLFMCYLLVVM